MCIESYSKTMQRQRGMEPASNRSSGLDDSSETREEMTGIPLASECGDALANDMNRQRSFELQDYYFHRTGHTIGHMEQEPFNRVQLPNASYWNQEIFMSSLSPSAHHHHSQNSLLSLADRNRLGTTPQTASVSFMDYFARRQQLLNLQKQLETVEAAQRESLLNASFQQRSVPSHTPSVANHGTGSPMNIVPMPGFQHSPAVQVQHQHPSRWNETSGSESAVAFPAATQLDSFRFDPNAKQTSTAEDDRAVVLNPLVGGDLFAGAREERALESLSPASKTDIRARDDVAADSPDFTKGTKSSFKATAAKKVFKRKAGSRDRRFNSSTPVSLVASARSATTEVLELAEREPVSMYLKMDEDNLSDYQCFLRQQIEIFEAGADDLQYNAQKMNKAVVLGQVGIRCRHCAHLDLWKRLRGAVYYSASLGGLYQAAQNMSKNHLETNCNAIPDEIQQKLLRLKESKRRAGGGKLYWAESAASLGLFEDQYGLRFLKEELAHSNSSFQDQRHNAMDESMSSSGSYRLSEYGAKHYPGDADIV